MSGERRTALVTGSAGGIGRAIAVALQAAGLDVVGADRVPQDDSALERTVVVDLADPAACEAAVAAVGRVDVLVNNAAVLVDRRLEDMRLRDFDDLFHVNLRAPVLLTRAVLPGMTSRGWGRVVNLSSVGARTGGMSQSAVYNMTKAGMGSFTRFVARHYAAHGVTCNAVAPGGVRTGMTAHLDAQALEEVVRQIPVGRMAEPHDVAGAVVFLSSDGAAFVNGVTLDVNGGWVMS